MELAPDTLPEPKGVIQFLTSEDGTSVATHRLGGRDYALKHVPNCRVCTSPIRLKIETAILHGLSIASIIKAIPEGHKTVSSKSIGRHWRSHMPSNQTYQRILMEEYAREAGWDPEVHEGILANYITFARLGVQKVFMEMADGSLTPTIKEAIDMSKLLNDIESRAGGAIDSQYFYNLFVTHYQAMVQEVDSVTLERIARRISSQQEYAGLLSQVSQTLEGRLSGPDEYEDEDEDKDEME